MLACKSNSSRPAVHPPPATTQKPHATHLITVFAVYNSWCVPVLRGQRRCKPSYLRCAACSLLFHAPRHVRRFSFYARGSHVAPANRLA
eukprot:5521420-Pleurochrysis_carterae.AAC.1